ncbi:MAG: beta-ketoacyl-ACP synthase III [Candidatus Anammoxibacter sp.]
MDKTQNISITGLGAFLPEKVLSNADLERLVDTTDEWITKRTGIKERRIVENGVVTSDLAAKASLKAISDAGISPLDIDLIITSTVTPDHLFPSTSCYVQEKIGATNAGAFDVLAACAGFVYALSIAHGFVAAGTMNCVLVIGAECLSKFTDYTDRTSCILFGDGAGAAVVQKTSSKSEILSFVLGADGSNTDILILPGGGSRNPPSKKTVDEGLHYMRIKGKEVFKMATNNLVSLVNSTLDKCGMKLEDIDLIVPHQSNLRIIKASMKKLAMPMDKVYVNIDRYGNTSSASVPIALSEIKESGRLKQGDLVLLATLGGGLTWSATILRW